MSETQSNRIGTRFVIAAVVVAVALVGGGAYWFANRDSGSAKEKSPTTNTTLGDQTFKMSGVPFTFKYPGTFARGKTATGFLWIAGVSPVDILDVRRVDDREYSAKAIGTVMDTRLGGQSGVTVQGKGTNTYGGQPVVTYTVTSGTDPVLESQLVFFSKGGSTWQLECQSQPSHREEIDAGCAQMLSTLTFS